MASYYKRLKTDLAAAAADGLITGEQAGALYEKIHSRRMFASFKAGHWIGLMAGLFIAAGVSLIIAHNWDRIGAAAKMLAYLAAFAAVAEASIRFEAKPSIALPAGVIWFFMPIIGIGLYAQIFNLSGDPIKPFLVWLALVIPLAVFAENKFHAAMTIVLAFIVLYYGSFNGQNMLSLVESYWRGSEAAPLLHWFWPPLLMFTAYALYFFKIKTGGLSRLLGLCLIWLFFIMVAPTALQLKSMVFVMLSCISLAVVWLVLTREEEGGSRLPALAWTGVVYAMTFFWHYNSYETGPHGDAVAGVAVVWLIFAAAVILTVMRPFKIFNAEGWWETGAKIVLVVSMVMVFLLFDATPLNSKIIAVGANLIIILTGLALIMDGSGSSNEKEINSGVALIFLIIVTRFIDLFGNLLRSGFAFIAAGLALAGLAYLVNRGRKALISRYL